MLSLMIEVRVKVIFLQELHDYFSLTNTEIFLIETFEIKKFKKLKRTIIFLRCGSDFKEGHYEYSIWRPYL
jgi:hypothetical protein